MPRGLSPLAQGNRCGPPHLASCLGPIPARAGEPLWDWRADVAERAYPRSRRGTVCVDCAAPDDTGLSPLAQGNRVIASVGRGACGPIPARAGEPPLREVMPLYERAYPCSRRGTRIGQRYRYYLQGLSLLAQGNLFVRNVARM